MDQPVWSREISTKRCGGPRIESNSMERYRATEKISIATEEWREPEDCSHRSNWCNASARRGTSARNKLETNTGSGSIHETRHPTAGNGGAGRVKRPTEVYQIPRMGVHGGM